jgi:hypothetical protein
MSQMTGPPLAKSVGMGSLKAFALKIQSAKIRKPPGRPGRQSFPSAKNKNLSWRPWRLGG